MRTLLFALMLIATPCYADSLWGDYGDIGPRGGEYLDDYIGDPRVYGSVSQQLQNIQTEIQWRNMQDRRYREAELEEMRRANELAEDEARERRLRQQREDVRDILRAFGR